MKTRLLCALIALLLLVSACVTQPAPIRQVRKDVRTPMPAGHYSLVFIPAVRESHISIPVTGQSLSWQDFLNPCHGRMNSVYPRFGRSLHSPCRDG